MTKKLPLLLASLLLSVFALKSPCHAQVKAVSKTPSTNAITEDLVFPSARTLTLSGTLSGTPTGGTLSLANLTLTLPSDVTRLGATIDLSGAEVTGSLPWASVSKTSSSLADLITRSAGDLSSGTLPDARFPATLPVASGVNLTVLNADNLGSGIVPAARLAAANLPPITLALSGVLHNTPVTITAGTGTATLVAQTANRALMGPLSGSAATPTFRGIAPQDTAERTTFSNAAATITAGTAYLGQTGTMTASRAVTLPLANAVPAGYQIVIADESGTVSNVNTIVLTRAGADTINGATTEAITAAYSHRRLISNGSDAWVFDAGIARLGAASNVFAGTATVNGNLTAGDASGDTLTINAGTVTAANATDTSSNRLINVATSDSRYLSRLAGDQSTAPLAAALAEYVPLRMGTTWQFAQSVFSAAFTTNTSSWVQLTKSQVASTGTGWARAGIYAFSQLSGGTAQTPTGRGFTFACVGNFPGDTAAIGLSTTLIFGSQLNETGGALTARGLRVSIVGNSPTSTYRVTAGIHDGTTETTSSANVSAYGTSGFFVRWLPVGGATPGNGSRLEVWGRESGASATLITATTLTGSIGSTIFAGSAFAVIFSSTGTTPGYTATWELGGLTTWWH